MKPPPSLGEDSVSGDTSPHLSSVTLSTPLPPLSSTPPPPPLSRSGSVFSSLFSSLSRLIDSTPENTSPTTPSHLPASARTTPTSTPPPRSSATLNPDDFTPSPSPSPSPSGFDLPSKGGSTTFETQPPQKLISPPSSFSSYATLSSSPSSSVTSPSSSASSTPVKKLSASTPPPSFSSYSAISAPSSSSSSPSSVQTPESIRPLSDLWSIVSLDNDEALTQLIIQHGALPIVSARNPWLQTALHMACERGSIRCVDVLLKSGSDVNSKDKTGWTPLHLACNDGQWLICELLLREGSPLLNSINCDGATAVHYLVKRLLSDSGESSLLSFKKVLELMLEKGAAINAPNNHGDTPLHRAVTLPQATRILIEKGAAINAAAIDGQTPLHYAILKGNEEVVNLLLELGADPTASSLRGTPLELTQATKNKGIAHALGMAVVARNSAANHPSILMSLTNSGNHLPILPSLEQDPHSTLRRSASVSSLNNYSQGSSRGSAIVSNSSIGDFSSLSFNTGGIDEVGSKLKLSRAKEQQSLRVRSHGYLLWDDEVIESHLSATSRLALSWRVNNCSNVASETVDNYRTLFGIPQTELLFDEYSCSIQTNPARPLHVGSLFIFIRHLCFYAPASGLPGSETAKILIPINEIKAISKMEGTIEITVPSAGRKFIFRGFVADTEEIGNMIEFARSQHNNEGLGEPLMHFGFPIHQMIGAIRNPTDYVDFRERFYDCQKQGLIAVCACTMQLYDESEGVLGNPEQGKLYIAHNSIRFFSQLRGQRRVTEISFLQIKEITPQRLTSKFNVTSVGSLRYSFFNFPSPFHFERTIATIQRTSSSVRNLPNILVVGATSLIGLLVVKELVGRTFVRIALDENHPSLGADQIKALGAESVHVSFFDPISLQKALLGITRVLLLSDQEDELSWQTQLLLEQISANSSSKFMESKVSLIVKLSSFSPLLEEEEEVTQALVEGIKNKIRKKVKILSRQRSTAIPSASSTPPTPSSQTSLPSSSSLTPRSLRPSTPTESPKTKAEVASTGTQFSYDRQSEILIETSGVPFVFLRCNSLMQHFASQPIKSQGAFLFSLGDSSISWVDARDVSLATAKILLSVDKKHQKKKYTLTGKANLNCTEVAAILSKAIKRKVVPLDLDEEELRRNLVTSGCCISNLNCILKTYQLARNNPVVSEVSSHLSELLGQDPGSFEDFVNDHLVLFIDPYLHSTGREERIALKALFNHLDTEETGFVTIDQFYESLGPFFVEIGLADALFDLLDRKHDGKLSEDEYLAGVMLFYRGTVEEKLELSFKLFNQHGHITSEDFHRRVVDKLYPVTSTSCSVEVEGYIMFVNQYIFLHSQGLGTRDPITIQEWVDRSLRHLKVLQLFGLLNVQLNPLTRYQDKDIIFGHPSWVSITNLYLGISRSILRFMDSPIAAWLPTKESFEEKFEQRLFDSATHTDSEKDWGFEEFAPNVFRKIRSILGITDHMYLTEMGIGKILASFLLGECSVPSEVNSSGRSGSRFFKSPGKKLLIKIIAPEEDALFKRILPSYFEYLLKNPNTLLTRFLGVYKLTHRAKEDIYVVMSNVLSNTIEIEEQYDLKGSTVGRHVSQEEALLKEDLALKDLNFKQLIQIGPARKAVLIEQIEKDCQWMASHSICDYSFLVGISHVQEPVTPDEEEAVNALNEGWGVNGGEGNGEGGGGHCLPPSLFRRYHGGILSEDKTVVYFIGIIDTITPYNYKKMGEYWFKRVRHEKSQISAIPPDDYRLRFQNYLGSIVR